MSSPGFTRSAHNVPLMPLTRLAALQSRRRWPGPQHRAVHQVLAGPGGGPHGGHFSVPEGRKEAVLTVARSEWHPRVVLADGQERWLGAGSEKVENEAIWSLRVVFQLNPHAKSKLLVT